MRTKKISPCTSALLLAVLAIGCDEDKRLVEQAREADERQAEQNRQIAHQNHQLAEATNQLIAADAKSRQELVALERDLQAERAVVGKQRDELEAERKGLASQRLQASLLVECIDGAMTVLACLLPLVLCWYLLVGLRDSGSDEPLGEMLAMELAADSPSPLLPAPDAPSAAIDGYLPSRRGGETEGLN